jgi:hypothetical protein
MARSAAKKGGATNEVLHGGTGDAGRPNIKIARQYYADALSEIKGNHLDQEDPTFAAEVMGQHAWLVYKVDRNDEAGIEELKVAEALAPKDALIHYKIGAIVAGEYITGGKTDQSKGSLAKEELASAISTEPDMPEAYWMLGLICDATASENEQRAYVEKFVKFSDNIRPELFFYSSWQIDGEKSAMRKYLDSFPPPAGTTQPH